MNYFFIKKTMKLYKYITIILLSAVFLTSCNSIKKTLTGAKKESVDEFLVKKKNPLILPPNFDDLPKPQKETKKNNIENKTIDFSEVLKKSENVSKNAKKKDQSLEKSISKILSSN